MADGFVRECKVQYFGQARKLARALSGSRGVVSFLRREIGDDARESLVAIYLNGRHVPISWQRVSVGTLTASLAHPREIFQAALLQGAGSLILAHNHPSGDPHPSSEDDEVTRRMREVGELVGVSLLDHVVIGMEDHYSYADNGWRRLSR